MLIFIDTEFTGLKTKTPFLLSIGMVSGDGLHEFYAEIPEGDGWTRSDCEDFTLDEVLPLMWGGSHEVSAKELPDRIRAWFESLPGTHRIASDNQVDVRFLNQVLGSAWPENLDHQWIHIGTMVGSPAYKKAVDAFLKAEKDRHAHHALIDARANRVGWLEWAGPYEERLSQPGEIREGTD